MIIRFGLWMLVMATMSSGLWAAEDAKAEKTMEWVVTLGCQMAHFQRETGAQTPGPAAKIAGKVYLLRGNVTKDYAKGGEWTITGRINPDGKSLDVVKMKKNE